MSKLTPPKMCLAKHICPSCPATHCIFSVTCPANLSHHQPPPLSQIFPPETTHPAHEWCEIVSALCDKCQAKQDERRLGKNRETTEWKRWLKAFKQKKN
jgi:hypothetical protein